MSQKTIQISFFIVLTLGLLILSFFILKPYLAVIFLAAVLAIVFHPLYQYFLTKFKGRRGWASFTTVLIIFVGILIPALLLSLSLLREAISLYNSLAFGGADKLIGEANAFLARLNGTFSNDPSAYLAVDNYARDVLDWVIGHFDSVFSAVFGSIFSFILMLLSLYYLLMYGEKIKTSIVIWSPLPDSYDEDIVNALRSSVDAVVRGRLLVSAAQGLLVGLGFLIFGIPNPVLWGFIAGIASLIPIVGTSLITLPAIAYLLLSQHLGQGIGLLLWSAICVGLVDNFLAFFFMRGKIAAHPLIILFSILGGVEIFGPIGFLLGPIAISALAAFMRVYPFIMFKKESQS